MVRVLALISALAAGCAPKAHTPTSAPIASQKPADGKPRTLESATDPYAWQEATYSPQPSTSESPALAPLRALCAGSDAALDRLAARLVRERLDEPKPLDISEVTFALRAEGSPYVWPRAWTIEGRSAGGPETRERMRRWLTSFDDGGQRRCGVASLRRDDGREVLVAVATDVLGELAHLPTRARVGQWLDVQAELLVEASAAKVVVLGPRGAPRSIPTSLSERRIFARFAADREGPWLVQILATVGGGPRQILEAAVYAGVEPEGAYIASPVPGEALAKGATDPKSALERMLNGARSSEGRKPLGRLPELDAIAQQHADAMRDARRIAHDLGRGDPNARVAEHNLRVRGAYENVAHGRDPVSAHRALWRSPSHRENLLQTGFDAVGIGVAIDPDGSVWVCELFADY